MRKTAPVLHRSAARHCVNFFNLLSWQHETRYINSDDAPLCRTADKMKLSLLAQVVLAAGATAAAAGTTTTGTAQIDLTTETEDTSSSETSSSTSTSATVVYYTTVIGGVTTTPSSHYSQKFTSMYSTVDTPSAGEIGLGTLTGTVGVLRTYEEVTVSS